MALHWHDNEPTLIVQCVVDYSVGLDALALTAASLRFRERLVLRTQSSAIDQQPAGAVGNVRNPEVGDGYVGRLALQVGHGGAVRRHLHTPRRGTAEIRACE